MIFFVEVANKCGVYMDFFLSLFNCFLVIRSWDWNWLCEGTLVYLQVIQMAAHKEGCGRVCWSGMDSQCFLSVETKS